MILGLAGCSSGPSHLPPVWALPGAALGSAVENAAYDARRGRVSTYLADHSAAMRSELATGVGIHNKRVMDLAGVPPERRDGVSTEFRTSPDIYLGKSPSEALDIEAVTVLIMVNAS